ncbi:hypothetical protein, partial [Stenotrophomonas indicatrix]|uniref:hypothetical protein n=1 Tax=Stenotrophomonas indicatrix TaxID=2045451 RepID=UPI00289947EC
PRRLSTPTVPDSNQIRLGSRIHAADTPAQPTRPASDNFRVRPPTEKKKEEQEPKRVASLHGHRGRSRFPQENASDLFFLHPTPETAFAFAFAIRSAS